MTPGARVAAAAEILDQIHGGMPAEQALLRWSRASRYAGSGDRAAVRDHVFDAIRCRRSFSCIGGSESGRGLMIGLCRDGGIDPDTLFTGAGHAPEPLSPEERRSGARPQGAAALDCPDWALPLFRRAFGPEHEAVLRMLRHRADVFLRVARHRASVLVAQAALSRDGISTEPHPLSPTALRVVEGVRRIRQCKALADGLVELQDAASQAVCDAIPLPEDGRVLDLCAGGGGKALAIAARGATRVFATDADLGRMADLPKRASRARSDIRLMEPQEVSALAPFPLVVADVPCSGSGAWRRQPEAKWRLSAARLERLTTVQADILNRAATLTAKGGTLAYITCSVFDAENGDRAAAFINENAGWSMLSQRAWSPLQGADGFFLALFRKDA